MGQIRKCNKKMKQGGVIKKKKKRLRRVQQAIGLYYDDDFPKDVGAEMMTCGKCLKNASASAIS